MDRKVVSKFDLPCPKNHIHLHKLDCSLVLCKLNTTVGLNITGSDRTSASNDLYIMDNKKHYAYKIYSTYFKHFLTLWKTFKEISISPKKYSTEIKSFL